MKIAFEHGKIRTKIHLKNLIFAQSYKKSAPKDTLE